MVYKGREKYLLLATRNPWARQGSKPTIYALLRLKIRKQFKLIFGTIHPSKYAPIAQLDRVAPS